jgi:hypothetical protein
MSPQNSKFMNNYRCMTPYSLKTQKQWCIHFKIFKNVSNFNSRTMCRIPGRTFLTPLFIVLLTTQSEPEKEREGN